MCVSVIIIPIGIQKVNAKYIMDENRCIEKEPVGKSLVLVLRFLCRFFSYFPRLFLYEFKCLSFDDCPNFIL